VGDCSVALESSIVAFNNVVCIMWTAPSVVIRNSCFFNTSESFGPAKVLCRSRLAGTAI